ncbi:MAG: hypothetical protein LBH28_09645 [Oscillospiraceae bacterium]|nr:hypothetical protein [Oscillospiraceae bacterium]
MDSDKDNDNIRDYNISGDFSLESILAEYKGSAYIDGDKRTPPELLSEITDKIIKELESGAAEPSAQAEMPDEKAETGTASQELANEVVKEITQGIAQGVTQRIAQGVSQEGPQENSKEFSQENKSATTNQDILFFENYGFSATETHGSILYDVEKAIERELGREEESEQQRSSGGGFLRRLLGGRESFVPEKDEVYEEPDLKDAVKRFAEACNSISLRFFPAALITFIMVMITFAFESGMVIPFGIGRDYVAASGALIILMLIVMMLCIDLIVRGAVDLARGSPNTETLLLFSCGFSFISGAYSMLKGTSGVLAYCAVSALSLTFAAFGERCALRAYTDTLKTASSSSEPYGVQADYNGEISKSVLKKVYNRTNGFYNTLMHPDISETVQRYASPVLLVAALVLSLIAALAKGRGEYFLHILSALLASAASFSAMLAFSFPFNMIAKAIRKSGAALAGWGGADDICFSDGACVTDDDLFPPGTLSINGIKLSEGVSAEKAIRYTASLIIASNSGLSHMFSDVLKTQGMGVIRVEGFSCKDGGVSALIRGESVATGSAAFMNLLGIRIPDDLNMKNAVYTAINGRMIAMFAINYDPLVSVQSALVSVLKWRVKLFFAMRDFNITPLMLKQKFKVSLEDFEFTQARDSYNISDLNSGREGRIAAVLTREGLGPFAEAVTGGRMLKSVALVATAISIISAVFGVLIVFYLCLSGAFLSARPGNIILFMLSMLAAVFVTCGYARFRK